MPSSQTLRSRELRQRTAKWPRSGLLAVVLAGAGVVGCGPRQVVVLEPPVNAQEVTVRLRNTERMETPLRVVFEWSMSEQGVRLSGRGVARMEPPFKSRLDLFLDNGEPAGRAAMVEDDLRIPVDLPPQVLPPANLLWSALGTFRPGLGTALLGAERADGGLRVRYGLPGGDEAVYHLREGRIEQVEVVRQGTVVQRLTIERDALQVPVEAI